MPRRPASTTKREEADHSVLRLARTEAERQASLFAAERNYHRVYRLALQHRSLLAAVLHVLKQPISPLHLAIDGLRVEFVNRDRFYQAIDSIGNAGALWRVSPAGRPGAHSAVR